MTVLAFKDLLLTCCNKVYHREADKADPEYIVWSESGTYPLFHGDNTRTEEAQVIAVDLLTKEEFSAIPVLLRAAFSDEEIVYRGPDVIYHPDLGYTQYAYTVELI